MQRPLCFFEEIRAPFGEVVALVADRLAAAPANILLPFGRLEIARRVEVHGDDRSPERGRHVRIPIRWHPGPSPSPVPLIEATIQIDALSSEPPLTQVCLLGLYRLPPGPVGAMADLFAGHRVAESALRTYVSQLVEHIRSAQATRHAA